MEWSKLKKMFTGCFKNYDKRFDDLELKVDVLIEIFEKQNISVPEEIKVSHESIKISPEHVKLEETVNSLDDELEKAIKLSRRN